MASSERADQDRRRDAAARELGRLRAADEPDQEPEVNDPVDTVAEEQRRTREAQDDDPPY
jgi:hypothetical protein